MLVVTGLWLGGAGLVALSLESIGAALAFFGLAGLLIQLAQDWPSTTRHGPLSRTGPPLPLNSQRFLQSAFKIPGALRPMMIA
jgi:hypothetical protein